MRLVLLAVTFASLFLPVWCNESDANVADLSEELIAFASSKEPQRLSQAKGLIADGADVNHFGEYNYTALHWAVVRQKEDLVKILLEAGGNPKALSVWGRDVLFTAAWEDNVNIINLLVKHGADVLYGEPDGWTPLHKAASIGHEEVVQALLDAGSDPLLQTQKGQTTIDIANPKVRAMLEDAAKKGTAQAQDSLAEMQEVLHGEDSFAEKIPLKEEL